MQIGEHSVIEGGLIYDDNGHDPTSSVRQLNKLTVFSNPNWDKKDAMSDEWAFFCSINVMDVGFLAIGGLGKDKNGTDNVVRRSLEYNKLELSCAKLRKAKATYYLESSYPLAGS